MSHILKTKRAFSFGENWDKFVDRALTPERIEIARRHLLDFIEIPDLHGRSFLDIGSGSGLSSLAAYDSGARRIVSFDIDPMSVVATSKLRTMRGNPENWTVCIGSILDAGFISQIEPADVVYSWGVLHHTGRMWEAVRHTARLVAPGGLFYVGLYTTTEQTPFWIRVKQHYNRASPTGKTFMEIGYILRNLLPAFVLRGQNPIRRVREYKSKRGMDYLTDVRDWLGGYPYETAKVEEVMRFCQREFGMSLVNLRTGHAVNEYLFANHG